MIAIDMGAIKSQLFQPLRPFKLLNYSIPILCTKTTSFDLSILVWPGQIFGGERRYGGVAVLMGREAGWPVSGKPGKVGNKSGNFVRNLEILSKNFRCTSATRYYFFEQ